MACGFGLPCGIFFLCYFSLSYCYIFEWNELYSLHMLRIIIISNSLGVYVPLSECTWVDFSPKRNIFITGNIIVVFRGSWDQPKICDQLLMIELCYCVNVEYVVKMMLENDIVVVTSIVVKFTKLHEYDDQ